MYEAGYLFMTGNKNKAAASDATALIKINLSDQPKLRQRELPV